MNKSGITPVEYNVLVKQKAVEEKTAGGLLITDEMQSQSRHGETRGKLVAASPMAFNFEDWPDGISKPEVGQEVIFARHAGTFVEGADGEEYRVVKDKDIVAVMA